MNNDILESEEFNNLMEMACTAATKNEVNIVAAKIKSLIRNHYTPKTVEENCCVFRDALDNMMGVKEHKFIYDDDVILFTGTREECETEMKRLESLTKGREESKIICMGEAFGRARCPVDCQNCIDMDEEHESASLRAQPTTNRDNYREEKSITITVTVTEDGRNSFKMDRIGFSSVAEIVGTLQIAMYSELKEGGETSTYDKEVKSNPEAE